MKFIIFYHGPATPPDASHKGWMAWFRNLGNALVDQGSPISQGTTVHGDGSTAASKVGYNGYSIIEASDMDKAQELVKDHPYLALGNAYSIEIFRRG